MATTAQTLNQQAAILIRQGRFDEARIHLQEALRLQPDHADAHANLGNVFAYQQRYDEAIAQYQQALRLNPDLFAAHYILAIALHDKGKWNEAEVHYRQALRLHPDHAEAHHSLGITLMALGRVDEAVACYRQALHLNPNFADAYNNLANALGQQDKLQEAINCYHQAIRLNPNCAEAHFNLAIALERQDNVDQAIQHYRQAIMLKQNYVGAYMNLGNALAGQGKPDHAIRCYQQALQARPNFAEAYTNMGNVHRDQGRFDQALACFEQALRQDAGLEGPHHNRALLWLLLGNWSKGWPEYEWRWQTTDFPRYAFRQPRWDGSPLAGRTILLLAEQGLGDTLQFIRYVPIIQQRGGRVILLCQAPLQRLLVDLFSPAQVVVQGASLPEFDVYAPLLSLPGILGPFPTDFPADVPYLHAAGELVERWRRESRKSEVGSRKSEVGSPKSEEVQLTSDIRHPTSDFFVGIAWQGSPVYRYDRQRSIPLAHFSRLAAVPGVRLISLQKGPGMDQLKQLRIADCGLRIERQETKPLLESAIRNSQSAILDLSSRLDETSGAFMDTAALMKNLDLVISSDTAIPHLAGALAVPIWVALPLIPDWRWLLEREDSPWYPTMRLFRQTRQSNWEDVFERIAKELKAVVSCQKTDY